MVSFNVLDTSGYFHLVQDTVHLVVNTAGSGIQNSSSENRFLYTALATLIGSVLGSIVTIVLKKKEFKNFQDTLNLQKQLFEETKTNNENQMKAELIRLKDLRMQYELSLKKFDFDHLKELLEFADDKNEKVFMLKEFASILSRFNPVIPAWVEDYGEYQQIVVDHTYYRLEDIEKEIKGLLEKHVTTFASLHGSFRDVSAQANSINQQKAHFTMHLEGDHDEYIIHQLFESLFKLYQDYNRLMELMQEEFVELDKMKRDFILGKSKKDTHKK
jgi:hypothetical protein